MIKRHIHLWPLWSSVVQGELDRFTECDVDVEHVALWQILSTIDLFLTYRTDSTDSLTI